MRHKSRIVPGVIVAAAACLEVALGQPPEGDRPPGPPGRGTPPPFMFMDPLRAALDTDKNQEIDAAEIAKAPEALATLDKNHDGKLDLAELRPQPPMGPPGQDGFRGPPRDGGPEGGFRRPPREGGPEGAPGRPPGSEGGPGPGGPGGPTGPGPEQIVERAMSFDADGDGKLDRSELRRFADEVAQRMRAGGDRGPRPDGDRGLRPGGDRGPRPDGDRGPRPDGPPEGGERPERPRRPE